MHESRSPRTDSLYTSIKQCSTYFRYNKRRERTCTKSSPSQRLPLHPTLWLWRAVWLYPNSSLTGCEVRKVGACRKVTAPCCLIRTQEHTEPKKGKTVPHKVTSSARAVRALSVSVGKCPSPGPILMLQSYRVRGVFLS